ncbi:NAD(P)/FAD-dependent oxidoreductase, partial [Candidatus Bathyarchaeota archaeon]|nr:NAD(P)/FAD-dependent oxidoreductase [Candidatus Bathyarchaeota archaeon]
MKQYDVIVVGAGTGGSMTAKTVASKGFSVCLVDRKDRNTIGQKVCGDAIGKHHFDNLGLKYPSGREKEGDIIGINVHSPDLQTVFRIVGEGLTGFMINRYLFGQRLLKDALDAGAELFDSTHVLEPIIDDRKVKGVEARLLKEEAKTKILGNVVVDASGVSAIVRSQLPPEIGLETNVRNEDTVVCYREIRELKEQVDEPTFCEIYLDLEKAEGGYYWIFPEGNTKVNVGLGVAAVKGHPNPKDMLYKHVLTMPMFRNSTLIHGGGGIVPTRRPLDSLVGNGIVVVGDAGCQVNPIHGGGIGPSMMGGAIAGTVIAEALERGQLKVENLWPINIHFMKSYGAKQAGLDVFRTFLQSVSNDDLNYGMKYRLIKEEDVLKASLGEEIRLNVTDASQRVFKGLGRLSFLKSLYKMAKNVKKVKTLYNEYPSS